jgi:hypothetical protein
MSVAGMDKDDYSFLFDPPKDSNVFTRILYYPRSPNSPDPSTSSVHSAPTNSVTSIQSSLGANRHAATLSKFTAGVSASNSAAPGTVAPFLNDHIPDQVRGPDIRENHNFNNVQNKSYCYRHQPGSRCQRQTPQEDTVAEIQKVFCLTVAQT